jgi:hypothetical protein
MCRRGLLCVSSRYIHVLVTDFVPQKEMFVIWQESQYRLLYRCLSVNPTNFKCRKFRPLLLHLMAYDVVILSEPHSQEIFGGKGRAIAQAVSRRLPTTAARVQTWVGSCGILWWTKVALGQVFSENFGFLLPIYIPSASPQSSSLSPEAGTIDQEWPQCQ